jgi:hypothetical protein
MATSRFLFVIGLVGLTSFSIASGCDDGSSTDAAGGTPGTEGHACRSDGTCDAGLSCLSNLCVDSGSATGGTGTGGAVASGGNGSNLGGGNGEAGADAGGAGGAGGEESGVGGGTQVPEELDCREEGSYLICGNAGVTWTEAQAYCLSEGGALVEINDADENNDLVDLVTESGSIWIGANDRDTEGEFRWTDGSQVVGDNAHWADGQPNNSGDGENCVVLHADGGDWNDVACDETEFGELGMTFVCELN